MVRQSVTKEFTSDPGLANAGPKCPKCVPLYLPGISTGQLWRYTTLMMQSYIPAAPVAAAAVSGCSPDGEWGRPGWAAVRRVELQVCCQQGGWWCPVKLSSVAELHIVF